MSSTRASTSAVSLEDWDSLAPLSETSKTSVSSIAESLSEKALPAKLARSIALSNATTRPGTPSGALGSTNLLRRATSRVDLANVSALSAASSAPGTPRARSPSRRLEGFSPILGDRTQHHARNPSTSTVGRESALGLSMTTAGAHGANGTTASNARAGVSWMASPAADPLEITSPIETTQQFLDWFTRVEGAIELEQEEVFHRYSFEIDSYAASCREGLEMLEDSRGLIKEMEANYRYVEENSRSLQLACEQMLADQKHLLEVEERINARLEYFKELERATRSLSQPGEQVVMQEGFLSMLERLDACLAFLRANRSYRDAEVYIIRFQQCLTRAMTLIKMHFLQTLNTLNAEVSEKLASSRSGSSTSLSEPALNALLYSKFTTMSHISRVLLFELEKRGAAEPDEYGSLLNECLSTWFSVRTQLVGPRIQEEVRRMDLSNVQANTDVVKLTREGCGYLRNVCQSEHALFREFFSQAGQPEVNRYLETLCDYLYDSLRPRILHEPKLEVLCELCNVLQALMSLDGDPEDDDNEVQPDAGVEATSFSVDRTLTQAGDESSFDISIPKTANNGLAETPLPASHRMRFATLLSPVHQDAQTRLVFRAQYVIEAEVLHYAPKPADLEYPEKLESMRSKGGKGKEREKTLSEWLRDSTAGLTDEEGPQSGFRLPPEELMESWYPTLRKTIWVLSKLHSYVNPAVFEDFAGEAVTLCRQSLVTASERVATRPGTSRLDGQLFVIRHLLILKEMVRSVDLIQRERNIDWGNVTDALSTLLRNTSTLFNPNALYQLASRGLPTFAETMRDSKRDLDGTLKLICEDFMTHAALLVCSSIRAYLSRCQSFLASAPAGSASAPDLTAQAWATAEEVIKLHDTFLAETSDSGSGSMESALLEVLAKLGLYLEDPKTIAVLLPPTQAEVLEHYTTFWNLVREEYDFETAKRLTPPARVRERLKALAAEFLPAAAVSAGGGAAGGNVLAGWEKSRQG